MKTAWLVPLISCIAIAGPGSLYGEELLLHTGPVFSTPGLGLKLDSGEIPGEELKFRRAFYLDSKDLPGLVDASVDNGEPMVSAERAIHLISKQEDLTGKAVITRLELLVFQTEDFVRTNYYLFEYRANGSIEHRVVLMDERILRPRLEKL